MGQTEGEPVGAGAEPDLRQPGAAGLLQRRFPRDHHGSTPVAPPLFRMEGVSKRYGGVRALRECRADRRGGPHPRHPGRERRRQVDADQDHGRRGRRPTRAACCSTGREVTFASPAAAAAAGIACVFQELSLVPDLSVADNIAIERSAAALRADRPRARSGGSPRRRWRAPAPRTSIRAPASRTCRCRAARWSRSPRRWRCKPRILILDEATSALTASDVAKVFAVLKRLAPGGPGAALHLAPHARDRRAGGRVHGVPQRPQRRQLSAPAPRPTTRSSS